MCFTWYQAQSYCHAFGYYLASVHTYDQNIGSLVACGSTTTRYVSGLTDITTEASSVNDDGTYADYFYSSRGQPDNANSNEDCVQKMD